MAKKIKLPENCEKVDRNTTRKVTPGERGELRSCARLVDKLLRDPRFGNMSANTGQTMATIGSFRSTCDKVQLVLANCGQNVAKIWPTLAQSWLISAQIR